MFSRSNHLAAGGNSMEDAMKYNVNIKQSRDIYDQSLYKEAARRVVYDNCLGACELTREDVPHFNAQFYYNQKDRQVCLEDCYNTRMKLHFGSAAEKEGMLISFNQMFEEYKHYEKWNPRHKISKKFVRGKEDEEVRDITQQLLSKTRAANSKF